MSIRGKDRCNAVLEKLLWLLWVGDVPEATVFLSSLSVADLKNQKWRDNIQQCFEKKSSAIPFYVFRARTGLCNSGNSVEKANAFIVARR